MPESPELSAWTLGGASLHNIPLVIGGILRAGIAQGMVRADIDVDFVVEYWLQIIKGAHDPSVLARTAPAPREAFDKGIELFFRSLLTPEGRAGTRWGATTPDGAGD